MRTSVRLPPERQPSGLQPDNLAGPFLVPQSPPPIICASFVLDDFAQRVARHPRRTAQACVRLPPCCFFCVLLPQHHLHSQVRVCRSDREARHVRGCSLLLLRLWINHRVEEVTEHLQVGSSRQQVSTPGFPKRQHQRASRSGSSLRTMVARLGASYFEKWPMSHDSVWVSPSEVHQTVLLRWRASAHGRWAACWAACWVRRRPGHPFAPCCTGPSPFHTWRTRSSASHSPTTQVRRGRGLMVGPWGGMGEGPAKPTPTGTGRAWR